MVKARTDLGERKQLYAHDHEFIPDFLSCVEALKPTAIIGVSGMPGMFTRQVLEAMARAQPKTDRFLPFQSYLQDRMHSSGGVHLD